ncbi:hypothetical protein GGX14DRAFT_309868, partial [Mycena pura]
VTGLRASTNNRASTVLSVFLDAIEEYGLPSRMRADRGAENRLVSIYMIMKRARGCQFSKNAYRVEKFFFDPLDPLSCL